MKDGQQSDAVRQEQEIQALKAIFDDGFMDGPREKAWKGVASLNEFTLRVNHPVPHLSSKFLFHLSIVLPKTYPSRALPNIKIVQPTTGLDLLQIASANATLRHEAETLRGGEMLFQLATNCQEWLLHEFPESAHLPAASSLAAELDKRALAEAEAKRQVEQTLLRAQQEREDEAAQRLELEVRHTTEKREAKRRIAMQKLRDAPSPEPDLMSQDARVERFEKEIQINRSDFFQTVNLSRPQRSEFGITYSAEPMIEQSIQLPPLEVLVISFNAEYYRTSQGWRKLEELHQELQRLSELRHPYLQQTYAVKLNKQRDGVNPRLYILRDEGPSFTLNDMLKACDSLSLNTTMEYLRQTLEALSVLHNNYLEHRYLTTCHIGLIRDPTNGLSSVKLLSPIYYSLIAGLNRSNSFGLEIVTDPPWPDGWLSREMVQSPLAIDASRDVYHLAVITFEMACGLDVTRAYPHPHAALKTIPEPWRAIVKRMLDSKEQSMCSSLLDSLSNITSSNRLVSPRGGLKITNNLPKASSDTETVGPTIPQNARQGSRYRNDWEELEFLGSGGFGEVVKAKNKLDGRIYAVKKIRLRPSDNDAKIFREVNALARLSHRFIVRYYTTWIEISEGFDSPALSRNHSGSTLESDLDDTPRTSSRTPDVFQIDLNDLARSSNDTESFPGIYFGDNSEVPEFSDHDSDSEIETDAPQMSRSRLRTRIPASTLFIQMEYVENLTLKERIAGGLDEDEAWRLFHQLLDALVHMSSLGILHRDIKLNNVFIDANGDCKIGDFGLATSDIARHDPNMSASIIRNQDVDITMDVGTRLYVAPELIGKNAKNGPKNHSKADMYSLGIVFFEMNFTFKTGAERVTVIERLRQDNEAFPPTWEAHRLRQRKIISLLLLHDATVRPSALELSQSTLLPPRLEDESLQRALRVLSKPDSPHHPVLLSLLFEQKQTQARAILYYADWSQGDQVRLESRITDRLASLFRLHGAIDHEPPLFLPVEVNQKGDASSAFFLDRQGDLVSLPRNNLVSFARLAALAKLKRIKRYHIGNVYQFKPGGGHPQSMKAAIFDIITPSITDGVEVALAECMLLVEQVINEFPGLLGTQAEFTLFHTQFSDYVLSRVDTHLHPELRSITSKVKTSFNVKRSALLRCGITRSLIDEIELFSSPMNSLEDLSGHINKLGKNGEVLMSALDSIKLTLKMLSALGFEKILKVQPLKLHQHRFKNGVAFEVALGSRRADILAAGGRYDHLFRSPGSPMSRSSEPTRAVAVQIALDRISSSLAEHQRKVVANLVKEQRSFGFWSPKRCDAYIISYLPGQLESRLELVALLWAHGISADIMYESGVEEGPEVVQELCRKEGILFMVWTRPKPKSNHTGIKILNTLTRAEHEVSRSELVAFLYHQLREQKRVDGTMNEGEQALRSTLALNRELSTASNVQLVLPVDRKHPKHNKKIMFDKATEVTEKIGMQLRTSGVPVIAIHVSPSSFDAIMTHPEWLWETDADAWRTVQDTFTPSTGYAIQIREAILKKKSEGSKLVILLSLKDDRLHLVDLS